MTIKNLFIVIIVIVINTSELNSEHMVQVMVAGLNKATISMHWYCGRRRVRLCLPRRRSTLVVRWVECWTADSGNRSDVGSNPSDGSCDIWCQKWDHGRESRRTTIEGQGGPNTRGVRVKAGQDRGSRRATIGGQGGQRWRAKADRDHSEIKKGE